MTIESWVILFIFNLFFAVISKNRFFSGLSFIAVGVCVARIAMHLHGIF